MGIFLLLGEDGGDDNWQTSEGGEKMEGKRKEIKIGKEAVVEMIRGVSTSLPASPALLNSTTHASDHN